MSVTTQVDLENESHFELFENVRQEILTDLKLFAASSSVVTPADRRHVVPDPAAKDRDFLVQPHALVGIWCEFESGDDVRAGSRRRKFDAPPVFVEIVDPVVEIRRVQPRDDFEWVVVWTFVLVVGCWHRERGWPSR